MISFLSFATNIIYEGKIIFYNITYSIIQKK
nr:MAG TPA: hypothetical protein [Caudoviricetes sp.]